MKKVPATTVEDLESMVEHLSGRIRRLRRDAEPPDTRVMQEVERLLTEASLLLADEDDPELIEMRDSLRNALFARAGRRLG